MLRDSGVQEFQVKVELQGVSYSSYKTKIVVACTLLVA